MEPELLPELEWLVAQLTILCHFGQLVSSVLEQLVCIGMIFPDTLFERCLRIQYPQQEQAEGIRMSSRQKDEF